MPGFWQAILITAAMIAMVTLAVVGIWVSRMKRTSWDDHDMIRNNPHVMAYFVGFAAVQAFGVSPLMGVGLNNWWSLAWVAGGVVATSLAAAIAAWEADTLIIGERLKIDNLPQSSTARTLVRLGMFFVAASVGMGAFTGSGPSVALNVAASAMLIAGGLIAAPVFFHLTPIFTGVLLRSRIRDEDCLTSGITAAGQLVYIGLALYYAAAGGFDDLKALLVRTLLGLATAFVGGLLLALLVDKVVLTKDSLRSIHQEGQKNPVAAGALAGLLPVLAAMTSPALNGLVSALL